MLAPRYPNPAIPGSKLELVFVHPDPVLGVHLARQKLSLMGRGVLEFIHPAERERELLMKRAQQLIYRSQTGLEQCHSKR